MTPRGMFRVSKAEVGLGPRLVSAGVDWTLLTNSSRAVLLFGSRAAGTNRADSDWDILCIGSTHRRVRRNGIDLVPVRPELVASPLWLESELATHVAAYGRVLVGDESCLQKSTVTRRTELEKKSRIEGKLEALRRLSPLLSASRVARLLVRVRRDMQRLDSLVQGVPVPPTAELDRAWTHLALSSNPLPFAVESLGSLGRRLARCGRGVEASLLEVVCDDQG